MEVNKVCSCSVTFSVVGTLSREESLFEDGSIEDLLVDEWGKGKFNE